MSGCRVNTQIMFEIQQAGLRDLKELHALEHACFDQDAWTYLDLIGVLTLPATVRLKAVIEEKMVGFIAGDIRSIKKNRLDCNYRCSAGVS